MLLRFLQRLLAAIRRRRQHAEAARLARRLACDPGYSFTADYVTGHTDQWSALLAHFQGRADVRMLEIGSFEGRSTVWFLEHVLTHPTARVVCVDPWLLETWEVRFDHNIRLTGATEKVTKHKGRSEDLLSQLPRESFDLIYVDGSHDARNVLFDAVNAWFLLKAGGVLIFDDYLWEMHLPPSQRPQMAIDLFLEAYQGRYELISKAYQVIILKRPPHSNA